MARLIYTDAKGTQRQHELGALTTLGRHPDQHIQILDRVVSKEHAVIKRDLQGIYWIVDGGSRNGTSLNGITITGPHQLNDGDAIKIGSTLLHFRTTPSTSFAEPQQQRVTILADHLDSVVRSRLAPEPQASFQPETLISDVVTLRQDYEKLRIAHELSQSIGVETDLNVLLEKILEKAFEIFPADHGVILLRLENSDHLVPMVVRSRDPNSTASDVRISRTILKEVFEEKQAVLSSDAMMDSRFSGAHSIILGQIRSTMSVPLLHEDQILGVIHLDSKIARGAFTEKDLEILSGFARQAAVLIEHQRLLKKMEGEIVAREKLHRLLSPQLVEEVVSGRLELKKGGETRQATVMFADIRNFTSFSERTTPQVMVDLLNEYFELMVDIIFKYEGTLDKFIGDEIMAVWGAPIGHPDDTERAVRCAIEMQATLNAFNRHRAPDDTLQIGIGLNSGELIAGYMGSTKSMNYTVMGDTVNTASRICSAAGPGEIVIGQNTFHQVQNIIEAEQLSPTSLKGKVEHVELYRVIGLRQRPVHPTFHTLPNT